MVNCIPFLNLLYPKTLQDIEWLKSITKLPILIKGVLTSEDGIYYWTLDVCIVYFCALIMYIRACTKQMAMKAEGWYLVLNRT